MDKGIVQKVGVGFVTLSLMGGFAADQAIDPYTKVANDYRMTISERVDAGKSDVVISELRPEVSLRKWDGEVSLKVRYNGVGAAGNRKALTNRIEWKDGVKEVHAYPLAPTEQMEDGGFEIEVVLNEKPDTNVFEFQVEGWENLDFFYQPELTAEEIEEGAQRPENIVGSYAVYHKTNKHHVVGGTNYATGKAFHIFRPKIIDAEDSEVWGELSYSEGLLTVIVPQEFLDVATYPVKVDPTFGYTSVGASNLSTFNPHGSPAVAPENGTITSISSYHIMSAGQKDFAAAIYSNGTGVPDSLLAEDSGNVSKTTTTAEWVTNPITYEMTGGTTYWIISWCNKVSGGGSCSYYYDTANTRSFNSTSVWETWAPWSSGGVSTRNVSAYATYEVPTSADPVIWFE